ncbi:MAG: hypothetical protein IPF92_13050 [Myxococcales bacterium]|nr:hypothetical protein [Myxococcales bacterium]
MHKLPQPRVRGTEDLRPKSDGRQVTKARAIDVPIGFWPTDLPIPYWPVLSAAERTLPLWAGELAGKSVGS